MQNKFFLDKDEFSRAISMLPLISIDFCIIYEGKILLGKRNNEPAKNFFFTPGGRIRKNERFEDALKRISVDELNFDISNKVGKRLMGIWDHFYDQSAYDKNISTHYVNLPHLFFLNKKEFQDLDLKSGESDQHSRWIWLELDNALVDDKVHKYIKQNIKWIKKNII